MCKSVWAISILVGQNKLLNWFTLFSVICTLSQWWILTLKMNDCSNNEVNVPTSNPCQLKAQATALNTEFQAVFCALGYIEVISLIWSPATAQR